DALYAYDGHLGPEYTNGEISVSVWAPTAQRVRLRIYDADKNPVALINPIERSVHNNGAQGADVEPDTDVVDRSLGDSDVKYSQNSEKKVQDRSRKMGRADGESTLRKNVSGDRVREETPGSNGVWTFKG